MAGKRKASIKKSPIKKRPAKTIPEQFREELEKETDMDINGVTVRMTHSQALVRTVMDKAMKGDDKALASAFKWVEKLEALKDTAPTEEPLRRTASNWLSLFAFFGKYKPLIEEEIERLRQENPKYWGFEWFNPTRENAPWYAEIHGKKT